ncbi:hypothetical protein PIB30_015114 [Stylosanthes scabra]|uniref:RNase H type-1 domain-containing protein n=1 Tax=Stylosanthes scabra TaxID=79078 RepID=A0ABU6R784_9FABA|nr:hypothetical protein [Stylosanthes scabra]
MDISLAIEAEIRAILQGVEVAWERNLKKIILESDSKSAIELIANPPQNYHLFTRMIRRIRNLANRYRMLSSNTPLERWILDDPPPELNLAIWADSCGSLYVKAETLKTQQLWWQLCHSSSLPPLSLYTLNLTRLRGADPTRHCDASSLCASGSREAWCFCSLRGCWPLLRRSLRRPSSVSSVTDLKSSCVSPRGAGSEVRRSRWVRIMRHFALS